MESNYWQMGERAREHFLTYDQLALIEGWKLQADSEKIYVKYLGQDLWIDRRTGCIGPCEDPDEQIHLRMALYDLLTRPTPVPVPAGEYLSISSLGGIIGSKHETSLSYDADAARMDGHVQDLKRACEAMGGVPADRGDVSYILPVMELPHEDADGNRLVLKVWFRFWEKDEEFPAQIRYQWDANILQFMYYETVWYVMKHITRRLLKEIGVPVSE